MTLRPRLRTKRHRIGARPKRVNRVTLAAWALLPVFRVISEMQLYALP
jgi:hypothetical protein